MRESMGEQLWKHQQEAVEAALGAIEQGRPRGLWVMPTGSGKTVAFATLAARLGRPTLVLVHRRELASQAAEALESR